MARLSGKTTFISGGASGIGRAIAERFAAEGSDVYIGDVNAEQGRAVASAIGATFIRQDVSQEADWIAAMALIEEKSGKLDAIVNNAGVLGTGPLDQIDVDAWNRLFGINVTGVMLGCKHGARLMQKHAGQLGSIINISSNAGILGTAEDCGYSATKGAVRLMTKSIAADFGRRGIPIRCNSIHPGAVDTPIFDAFKTGPQELQDQLAAGLKKMSAMGRLGRPEEIAALALFLASDESTFSTGSEFVADGGATCALAGLS